jgi:hypothetical protein
MVRWTKEANHSKIRRMPKGLRFRLKREKSSFEG